jgi:pyruvate dehydrogenase E2 component (dihydrolipoamide acetyltransferase)
VDVVLPKNSLTMTEAEIIEWYIDEGGAVTAGEPLFLMETDKSQVDVEAAVSGTLLEIRAQPGARAAAGEVIAVIDTGQADASFTSSPAARSVAPAAAELADALGIDIETVRGSGSGGRVIEEDVLKAAQAATDSPSSEGQPAAAAVSSPSGVAPPSRPASFSRRRTAGNRSTQWAAAVPTFHLSAVVELPAGGRSGAATMSDLLVAAGARAAREVPVANAFVSDDGDVRLYDEVRVGLLVRDDDALLPLVFADADRIDLGELHKRRRELMAQVGDGALPAAATAWPTLVISNVGRPSVRWFTAVLFPGTSVTVAVGGLGVHGPHRAEIVLTCDHRVLDGVDAAAFASAFDTYLREI